MELARSLLLLFRGVLRRFLLWLPPIVLDRLDAMTLYDQSLKRYLPPGIQRVVALPLENLLILALVLVFWAVVLSYHELRMSSTREIAELKHRAALNLSVDVPLGVQLMRPSVSEPIEANGWTLLLQNVRITNRSATAHVSLGMTIHVRLKNAQTPKLSIREENDLGLWKLNLPQGLPQYLRCPLNIPPGQTAQGMLGFWVMPLAEHALGGGELDAAIARRGDPVYGVRDAELEITDYVSGQVLSFEVPGTHS